jgi:hypothetical protein
MSCLQTIPTQSQSVFYDLWQFDRRAKAVSVESGLSFDDYLNHCHIETRRGKRRGVEFTPAFANNSDQLRKVLSQEAWQYCHGRSPMPERISLAELRQALVIKEQKMRSRLRRRFSKKQKEIVARHVFVNDYNGGYLRVRATIAYLSWKLGYPSNKIAEQLFMAAPNVRIILYRLCNIARQLGYETFPKRRKRKSFTR